MTAQQGESPPVGGTTDRSGGSAAGGGGDAKAGQKGRGGGKAMRRVDTAAILDALGGGGGGGGGGDEEAGLGGGGGGDGDPLAFLARLSDRLQRVGMSFPGVEVRWSDLRVEVTVPRRGPKGHTLLSALGAAAHGALAPLRPLTTASQATASQATASRATTSQATAAAPQTQTQTQTRVILDAGSGVLSPGRLCLLLGPPGAGKTTLLRVLAGQLRPPAAASSSPSSPPPSSSSSSSSSSRLSKGGVRVSGRLSYNGLAPGRDFAVARSAAYVSQADTHIGEMSVEETLAFAAQCLGPGLNRQLHGLLRAKEAAAGLPPDPELDALWEAAYGPHGHTLMVEIFARLLGIDHVLDTVVGNEMLKGISGGQKRRVTCGEMAVGFAQVLMLDEITNGLDSNSALAIVRSLRNMCSYAQATMLVSLLQPSPELVACFDDVMLLSQGKLLFLGPREQVMPFFFGLGLAPPQTKTDADFLQEVIASPAYQARYRLPGGEAERAGAKWLSPVRLRQEFDASEPGTALAARLAEPPYSHPLQGLVLHRESHALSLPAMWRAVAGRELLLFRRNRAFFAAGFVQTTFTAFLVSTTFIRLSKTSFPDANLHLSVMFFSLMTIFMGGFNFCPIYCQRLAVFYKQRDHAFYTSAAYAVSAAVMRLPELIVQASVWALMVYFSCGFAQDAGRFFIFWLNLIAGGCYSVTLFQLLGAVSRHEVIAQGIGAVMLMLSVLASGFPIARTSIPPWWIWFYWANPMAWALRSMAINELTANAWTATAAEYDEPDKSIGVYTLEARGFFTSWAWVWAGIGTVFGLSLVLLGAQILALSYLGAPVAYRPPVDEDEEAEAGQAEAAAEAGADGERLGGGAGVHAVVAAAAGGGGGGGGGRAAVAEMALAGAAAAKSNGSTLTVANGGGGANGHANGHGGGGRDGGGGGDSAVGLSFSPVVMAFSGINYFVPNPKGAGELQLLRDVSGVFLPGVLTSLMGASGAGKTTLMDVLAGRKTGGRAEGLQAVNGQPKRMASFARLMGYVEQFDAHNPQATVEEALLFSAHLRVPPGVLRRAEVRPFVQRMMRLVELGPLAGHTVGYGGPGGGLSMEARKRLTIACELVANPAILFLDEPTTGLDARAAGMVMRAVRNTVATGRTVVCTIHQPNREIMDYFDELLLLKPGGRVIYNGPLGRGGGGGGGTDAGAAAAAASGALAAAGTNHQARLIAYLEAIPGVPRYEPHMNPANYMLEVTAPAAEKGLGLDFAEVWAASELASAAAARLQQHLGSASAASAAAEHPSQPPPPPPPAASRHAQPAWVQLAALLRRGLTSYWRNPAYNLLRLAVTILLGLALGTLYWDRGNKRTSLLGVLDIMGALFTTSLFLSMTNCLVVMPVVISDRAVFYRERASGMYGSAVFAAAQGLTEMPYLFVQSVLYVVIVYTTTHFEFDSEKALWFWLFIWLNIQAFTFLGMGAMNLTPNMPACVAASSLFVLLWNLFCGFLIYRDDIKPWWLWAYYFNPATYSIYGCITTQLGDLTNETIEVSKNEFKSVADYIQDTFNYHYDMRGWLVLILVGFVALFRAMSYIGLSYLNFQIR